MRVMILGLRGIPATEGGIERHVEALSPLLVEHGHDVEVVLRSPYKPPDGDSQWRGVHRTWMWSPRGVHFETIVHSVLGTMYAATRRPDVVHIHGIGPSLMAPLARLFGLRVITTHHGFDYDREKWGRFARTVLRLGEWAAARFSHEHIVISQTIKDVMEAQFDAACTVIPNGVFLPKISASTSHIDAFGIRPKRYILHVGRFVPEKRHLDLIAAFSEAGLDDWHLVLVGRCDGQDPYTRAVKDTASRMPNVILTGFQSGEALDQLYSHARAFVLPSSHEGLPISLLEALSYGLPVLASDIAPHRALALTPECYFALGNRNELAVKLRLVSVLEWDEALAERQRHWVAERYDWSRIAARTSALYANLHEVRPVPKRAGRH